MARLREITLYKNIKGYLYYKYGYVSRLFFLAAGGGICFLWKDMSCAVPANCCLFLW